MEEKQLRSILGEGVSSWMKKWKREEFKKMQKFTLFLFAVTLFFSLGGGLAMKPGPEGDRVAWAEERKSELSKSSSRVGPMLKLNPLVINLNEESGRHYVKATIVLEIGRKEWIEDVEKRIPSLTDMVILTLGDKKLQDLRHPRSKEELRKELLAKAQETLNSSKIKQIYFDEFLYQ